MRNAYLLLMLVARSYFVHLYCEFLFIYKIHTFAHMMQCAYAHNNVAHMVTNLKGHREIFLRERVAQQWNSANFNTCRFLVINGTERDIGLY